MIELRGLLGWKKFFKKFSIFYLWFWKYTKYHIYVEKNDLEYVNSGYVFLHCIYEECKPTPDKSKVVGTQKSEG